jgi:hypothetical protein
MQKFILMVLLATGGTALFASSTAVITFTGLPVVQGNGTTNSQETTYNGEVVATVNGIPAQNLVCDDFVDVTEVPSPALDFSVETIGNLSGSRFTGNFIGGLTGETGSMSAIQAYETAAVILANLELLTPNAANAQAITDYQYALWDLMSPNIAAANGVKDSPLDAAATADLQAAFTAVTSSHPTTATLQDEVALVIYTPTAANASDQEFLALNTPGTAPEPSTWLLMAALGSLFLLRQVRSRLQSASRK